MSRVVILVPAHNEAGTIQSLLRELVSGVPDDREVVVIPNGCSDNTAELARTFPVEVFELGSLRNGKAEALNLAWEQFARDADVVVCLDADIGLGSGAVERLIADVRDDQSISAACAAIRPIGEGNLAEYQRHLFRASDLVTDLSGSTLVLFGAATAFRGEVLRQVAEYNGGLPWRYGTQGEDFDLTCDVLEMGGRAVGADVFVEAPAPPDSKAFWMQALRWDTAAYRVLFGRSLGRGTRHAWLYWWGPLLALSAVRWAATGGLVLPSSPRRRRGAAVVMSFVVADVLLPEVLARRRGERCTIPWLLRTVFGYAKSAEAVAAAAIAAGEKVTGRSVDLW